MKKEQAHNMGHFGEGTVEGVLDSIDTARKNAESLISKSESYDDDTRKMGMRLRDQCF